MALCINIAEYKVYYPIHYYYLINHTIFSTNKYGILID